MERIVVSTLESSAKMFFSLDKYRFRKHFNEVLNLNTLLLLQSSFMLSVVKMLLKLEVGGHALNSHGNYIVDHGKIM